MNHGISKHRINMHKHSIVYIVENNRRNNRRIKLRSTLNTLVNIALNTLVNIGLFGPLW